MTRIRSGLSVGRKAEGRFYKKASIWNKNKYVRKELVEIFLKALKATLSTSE